MNLFFSDEELQGVEHAATEAQDNDFLPLQLKLAWALRQRDNERALTICEHVESQLAWCDERWCKLATARIALIRAEIHWLSGQLVIAHADTESSLALFGELADEEGLSDTHVMLAMLGSEDGCMDVELDHLQQALRHASAADDGMRIETSRMRIFRARVFSSHQPDEVEWVEYAEHLIGAMHVGVDVWIFNFLGMQALQHARFLRAVQLFLKAANAAQASGQPERFVIAMLNISACYNQINGHHAALEWQQRGLEIAKPLNWPRLAGMCLTEVGIAMLKMGETESAWMHLAEAREIMQPISHSSAYKINLMHAAETAVMRSDHALALEMYDELLHDEWVVNQQILYCQCLIGQAESLVASGKRDDAISDCEHAWKIALQCMDPSMQVKAMHLLAKMHDGATASGEKTLRLQYLLRAINCAEQVEGFVIPGPLLDDIADEYAARNELGLAYRYARLGGENRDRMHNKEMANRATAMEIHLQTAKAISDAESARKIAVEQSQRVEILQQYSDTLYRLGAIGQEITTHLNTKRICEVLSSHVLGLLDANRFAIFLLDRDARFLNRIYGHMEGRLEDPGTFDLDGRADDMVRCVRERREITIHGRLSSVLAAEMESCLLTPMIVADRVLGVLMVQSRRKLAYQETELLIFRTIASYAAIAFDNADAYQQLKNTKKQLLDREKMAALGSLVAGVAHELNTPIGNGLLIASTLQDSVNLIAVAMDGNGLRRKQMLDFVQESREGTRLIVQNLRSSASLIASFKQVAVDRTAEHKRPFDLLQVCQDVIASMHNRLKRAAHEMLVDIPEGVGMYSYPGPLGQVVTNLIENAIVHGFDEGQIGRIRLSAKVTDGQRVRIVFEDDGKGISSDNIRHIFEPFFTSRLGKGGSGLGLSISYNIITTILGGEVDVESAPGQGTRFVLDLPLEAPKSDA